MPLTPTPTDPGQTPPEPQLPEPLPPPDPDSPLSFVPHMPPPAPGQAPLPPFRIRTNRYGELEEHELVKLLDTIEDERARARFRESIYISFFTCCAIAWLILYGPHYLWHAPILINPADAIRQHELTQLNLPAMHRAPPTLAPKPLDTKTLDRVRTMTREHPAPAAPQPAAAPLQSAPQPAASAAPPPPPTPNPTPRAAPPAIADAPTPQPSTRPNFNTNTGTAADNIRNAVGNVASARSGHGPGFSASPSNPLGGGVDILSDTQGVDFDPYLRRILADIKRNWLPLIPEEARPPISKQGETYIRFTINPDGNIAVMHLDGSTHDVAIDHSCWSAIVSEGQFPPLPSQFHGPNLELRIHFLVNKNIEQ